MTRAVARLYRKYALDNAVVTLTIATRDPNECRVGVMSVILGPLARCLLIPYGRLQTFSLEAARHAVRNRACGAVSC
jgi:hypothetical protein